MISAQSTLWFRENISWAAGLLEGEGCFTVAPCKSVNGQYTYPYFKIDCTSTDRDVLERLQTIFGGYIYLLKKRPIEYKPAYRWCIQSKEHVYAVCAALYQFMCTRRKEKIKEMMLAFSANKKPMRSMVRDISGRYRINGRFAKST